MQQMTDDLVIDLRNEQSARIIEELQTELDKDKILIDRLSKENLHGIWAPQISHRKLKLYSSRSIEVSK